MATRNPSNWDDYDRGASPGRSGSTSSLGQSSSVQFEEQSLLHGESRAQGENWPNRIRRRSSVTNRLAAITEIGGVNSLRSFTRSWQRAAVFPEVIPQRPAFVFAPDQEPVQADPITYGRGDVENVAPQTSLLRQHLETTGYENAIDDEETGPSATTPPLLPHRRSSERKGFGNELSRVISPSTSVRSRGSIFEIQPHLASPPIVGSFSSYRSYGTVDSNVSRQSMAQAAELWRQQQEAGADVPEGVALLSYVLIGVGLLSLPIGLKYAGWLCGMIALALCAAVTSWTARILSRCMDLDPTVITFSDIAYISFGRKARIITSVLFTLELLAACVALIVLFAESLDLLLPATLTVTQWKIVCTIILVPLQFAPLRVLSFTSFVGIVCVFSIAVIVIVDGLLKPTTPGSLIQPAITYLFPENWLTLPLSFGLLMSPWGGHSVFPNIYRDMRHPYRYKEAVTITFTFTYLIDAAVAVVGYIMFGDGVRDAITSNLLRTTGYPQALNVLLVIFISIIPLTKIPLNAQPIVTTLELLTGLRTQVVADDSMLVGRSSVFRGL
ncbi:Transmembrane amino acid transporter [Apiospora rasikravindrae]|uniref:Transmembrane amino acid transporter n=1 Tax=Apiospora rasikravindrae TaxID=990691 RepID=A0ABR1UCG4_9PEZI